MATYSTYSQSVIDLCKHVQELQSSARTLDDIAEGLYIMADLFREVSKELGHHVFIGHYATPAEIYGMNVLDGKFQLIQCHNESDVSKDSQDILNVFKLTTYTDYTINLPLVFSKLPVLGIHVVDADLEEPACEIQDRTIHLSPDKWPLAATALLVNLYESGKEHTSLATQLLSHKYPHVDPVGLQAMLAVGMGDLTEIHAWLLENNKPRLTTSYTLDGLDNLSI